MIVAVALAAALMGQQADRTSSTFLNGNELLDFCRHLEAGQPSLHCAAYLLGLVDYESDLQVLGYGRRFCIPVGVTARQMRDVVVQHLENSSRDRHLSAASLALNALSENFPCSA